MRGEIQLASFNIWHTFLQWHAQTDSTFKHATHEKRIVSPASPCYNPHGWLGIKNGISIWTWPVTLSFCPPLTWLFPAFVQCRRRILLRAPIAWTWSPELTLQKNILDEAQVAFHTWSAARDSLLIYFLPQSSIQLPCRLLTLSIVTSQHFECLTLTSASSKQNN